MFLGLDILVDQRDLALHACELNLGSGYTLFQGLDAVPDAGDVAVEVVALSREGEKLGIDDVANLRIAHPAGQLRRKVNFIFLAHLRLQTGIDRREPRVAEEEPLHLGLGGRLIQFDQDLTGQNGVALVHHDVADNAAFQMLDNLVLASCHEHAGCHNGTGNRCGGAPDAKSHDRGCDDHNARNRGAAGRAWQVRVPGLIADYGCAHGRFSMRVPGVSPRSGVKHRRSRGAGRFAPHHERYQFVARSERLHGAVLQNHDLVDALQ